MIEYISEFGLPKEFSKKKKFDLMIGMFIPKDQWNDIDIKWPINYDLQKVYLTVEECSKATLEKALNEGIPEDTLKNGYIAIAMLTYPTTYLNEVPLARDVLNHTIDCEWDKDTLSFNFTIRMPNAPTGEYSWEDLNITTLKVDSLTSIEEDGKYKIASFNVYPVLDITRM